MVIMTNYFNFNFNRRGLIGSALATTAALTVGGPAYAFAAPVRVVRTRPQTLTAAGRPHAVETPGFRVHHLGVSWTGPETGGTLRLRYADGWRIWRPLTAIDSADRDRRRALLYVGDADGVRVRPGRRRRPGAVATPSTPSTARPPDRPGTGPATGTTLTYLSRSALGPPTSRSDSSPTALEKFPTAFFDVQTPDRAPHGERQRRYRSGRDGPGHLLLPVRHRGLRRHRLSPADRPGRDGLRGPVFRSGPPARCSGRAESARARRWSTAPTSPVSTPATSASPLLGDLTSTGPTAAARQALVTVLAALATATELKPLGTTDYVNPISGATRTVSTISGHRDWAPTECPGNTFYPQLPQLRIDVAAAMGPS